ncbi:MAG: valine--tRNA ligase [Xanthobacteraceae bacterium]|nr:valine--tRNA ligase [Xanthobacteraceae bacterium]QYK46292.1 MAG: valine--tRNA ligase [Xanthobacteraceae bacterium]
MLEKTYQPAEIEDRIYRAWEDTGAFDCMRAERKDAAPYSIVIPPPNVTGSLHMGHALNNTLQDILARFERMRGRDVLWQPGTDHAGIATQMVVERQLMERQQPGRREMGRDAFLKRVWEWKAESGGTIVNQLKRLGASCDWRRERFTMDEGLSRAVLKVFVELYRAGLIYKDKRLVNWDPKLLTAISDLEVQQIEVKGNLWHIKYPIEGSDEFIVVATTRPETMLGDTAVAVHPDDERYRKLVGKNVILPLVGRRIPIVADEYSDPEKGSGAVKITPAHDFNDFEVGKRHNLPLINIFTTEAKLALKGNEDFMQGADGADLNEVLALDGADRFKARKAIIEMLEARELMVKIEPNVHMVPHGDRSNVVIEPYLTDQWYVDAKTMAQEPLRAVRDGRTTFVPKNWEKTYFDWLENIQPWCISRQLWWGHQIPAWYGPDGKVFVAVSEDEAKAEAKKHYGKDETLTRDEDVLDTWFSSALWPFSTLGWPDKTPELSRFYPTTVLVTGFDIIFFWVARMMMMGLHFMKEVPFKDVYIHALVRDEKGAKMSKSKGNVMDPLELIDQYGADALRFTLAAMAAQGRDIKLATSRVEGYRNFATKIWNAARFAEMNGAKRMDSFDPKSAKETLNKWILGEAEKAVREVTEAIEAYKFNEAAGAAYRFVWSIFCDWYVELSKPLLTGADGAAKAETQATAAFVLDEIIKLLHPFMPFITEELWRVKGEEGAPRKSMLALAGWPSLSGLEDAKAENEIGWVVDLITAIRSVRMEMNIAGGTQIPLQLVAGAETKARAERWMEALKRLARLSEITFADAPPKGSVQLLVRGEVAALPLAGVVDLAAERARLEKEIAKCDADIQRVDKKLENKDFVARAPEEILELEKERRREAEERKTKILEALERLKGAA